MSKNWGKPRLLQETKSHRREVLVEIERKRIEFLASVISFEVFELIPPMLASVFPDLRLLLV